jgi:transglutaminase-like putative cysteine protease
MKYRRYRVVHRSRYHVEGNHAGASVIVQLTPRALPRQRLEMHQLVVRPLPVARRIESDRFGNRRVVVELPDASGSVDVTAISIVRAAAPSTATVDEERTWEEVVAATTAAEATAVELDSYVDSGPLPDEVDAFATEHFRPGRKLADALRALAERMRREFVLDPRPAAADAGLARFWHERRGVPADFAHLMLACLRSRGLAARHAAGYVAPRLAGSPGRSPHAWVSLWVGSETWLDVDPVHGRIGEFDHLVLGYGRDDGDLAPIRVMVRGAHCHRLEADVMVSLVDGSASGHPGRCAASR